jgi:signal transduction histidine kinase
VVTNAGAALGWLAAQPPNLDEGREALRHIVKNANRVGDVINRIRALVKKVPPRKTVLDPGLDKASSDRLFNPFYMTKADGMGMGLSICRSIIEAHGGRVCAAPNLPHGATFHFTLPLRQEDAS